MSIERESLGRGGSYLDYRCGLPEKLDGTGYNSEACLLKLQIPTSQSAHISPSILDILLCSETVQQADALVGQWTQGIPIEVVPFAYATVLHKLEEFGSPAKLADGKPGLSLRMGKMKAGPVITDNGNFVIDAPFPPGMMAKPAEVRYYLICTRSAAR